MTMHTGISIYMKINMNIMTTLTFQIILILI